MESDELSLLKNKIVELECTLFALNEEYKEYDKIIKNENEKLHIHMNVTNGISIGIFIVVCFIKVLFP